MSAANSEQPVSPSASKAATPVKALAPAPAAATAPASPTMNAADVALLAESPAPNNDTLLPSPVANGSTEPSGSTADASTLPADAPGSENADSSASKKRSSETLDETPAGDDGALDQAPKVTKVPEGIRVTRSRTGNSAPRKEDAFDMTQPETRRPVKRQKAQKPKGQPKNKRKEESAPEPSDTIAATSADGSVQNPNPAAAETKKKKSSSEHKKTSTPAKSKQTSKSSTTATLSPGISVKNGKLTFTLKPLGSKDETPSPSKANGSSQHTNGSATLENGDLDPAPAQVPEEPKKEKRKLLYAVKPPNFQPIETSLPPKILWARLAVRDFIIRFEKIEHIPARYFAALNNAAGEWDDRLYKSIVLMLFKIIYYDSVQVVPYKLQREYKKAVEKTQGNIAKVFALLDEFLYQTAFSSALITPPENQELGVDRQSLLQQQDDDDEDGDDDTRTRESSAGAGDFKAGVVPVVAPVDPVPKESFGDAALDSEYRHLVLLNNFIILASQTETIRSSVTNCAEAMRTAQKTLTTDIEKAETSFDKQLQKIRAQRKELGPHNENHSEKPKKVQLAELAQKEIALRQARTNKLYKARETHFFAQRRYTPKTVPLGMDYFGNTYWHFQQKSKDATEWGYWLVVERSTSVQYSFGLPQYLPPHLQKEDKAQEDEEDKGKASISNKRKKVVGERHDEEMYNSAHGRLYYMKPTKSQLVVLLNWLEYQRQVSLKPTTRSKKLLAGDTSVENTFANLVRYIKALQPFALEDEVVEPKEEEQAEAASAPADAASAPAPESAGKDDGEAVEPEKAEYSFAEGQEKEESEDDVKKGFFESRDEDTVMVDVF